MPKRKRSSSNQISNFAFKKFANEFELIRKAIKRNNVFEDETEFTFLKFYPDLNDETSGFFLSSIDLIVPDSKETTFKVGYLVVNSNDDLFVVLVCDSNKIVLNINSLQVNGTTKLLLFEKAQQFCLSKQIFFLVGKYQNNDCIELQVWIEEDYIFSNMQDYFWLKNNTFLEFMQFLHDYPNYKYSHGFSDKGMFMIKLSICIFFENVHSVSDISFEELYTLIFNQRTCPNDENVKHEKLRLELRDYQEDAIKWMLHQEKFVGVCQDDNFVEYCYSNRTLYYHKVLGHFVSSQFYRQYNQTRLQNKTLGGILADEMGMGKTIEVLALILNNQKAVNKEQSVINESNVYSLSENVLQGEIKCFCGLNSRNSIVYEQHSKDHIVELSLKNKYFLNDDLLKCLLCGNYQHLQCTEYFLETDNFHYLCCECWPKLDKLESPSTLIVCPKSILQQWINEIEKHVKDVSVFHYEGLRYKSKLFSNSFTNCNSM